MSLRDASGLLLAMQAKDYDLVDLILNYHDDELRDLILGVGWLTLALSEQLADELGVDLVSSLKTVAELLAAEE